MENEKHAILSASGSYRWLRCAPSAALEMTLPGEDSAYAAEGIAAHQLAETLLRCRFGKITTEAARAGMEAARKGYRGDHFQAEFMNPLREYVDQVTRIIDYNGVQNVGIHLEQRVYFSRWVPGGFGTADVILRYDRTIHVIDLKFGAGVPVSAKDNSQLMLYALGALERWNWAHDYDTVHMSIFQPRLNIASTSEISAGDLVMWANEYVRPRAELAYNGRGEFAPSESVCRFCRARAVCRARADSISLSSAWLDKSILKPEEIAELLIDAPATKRWAEDIQKYARTQAVDHGVHFPGWKLAEKYGHRKWIDDEESVEKALTAAGYADIFKTELKSVAVMEKEIGKQAFREMSGGLVTRPSSMALVPDDERTDEND